MTFGLAIIEETMTAGKFGYKDLSVLTLRIELFLFLFYVFREHMTLDPNHHDFWQVGKQGYDQF